MGNGRTDERGVGMRNKICNFCGKEFVGDHKTRYCRVECRVEMRRKRERERNRKKETPTGNNRVERARLEAEARKVGMHYGYYVALKGL